jgi:nucleoside-diphosphate kinase
MSELTFSIIKPDAMAKRLAGRILTRLEEEGFKPRGLRFMKLSEAQAQGFYAEHKDKPFFGSLVKFMTGGPVIVMALEKDHAVPDLRKLMGATDPAKADPNTLRKLYGSTIERNAIHGSADPESARREVHFFFPESELV